MTAYELLTELRQHGVVLKADGDRLRFKPRNLPAETVELLVQHKAVLLRLLQAEADPTKAAGPSGQQPEPAAPRCRRCPSRRFVDVVIHGGQSVRRDCKRCRCFWRFVQWYGVPSEN